MLVLLHGASGSPREMQPLVQALQPHFEVRAPALLGHAGRPMPDDYGFAAIVRDVLGWLDREGIGTADFVGYSLGGLIALYLARHHPERVGTLAAIAVKYIYDPAAVSHIVHLADPERIIRLGVRLDLQRQAHGEENWKRVLFANRRLFEGFGVKPPLDEADLRRIMTATLVVSGDSDQLVPIGETRRLAALLPNARLSTYAGAAHPITNLPAAHFARALRSFHADLKADLFKPGQVVDLTTDLVAGGLSGPVARVRVRKDPG